MAAVTVRELSYNPSAILARVEEGEVIDVTKHGNVIAVLVPPDRRRSREDELVASGALRLAERNLKAGDWDKFTHIRMPEGLDPVALLLEEREQDR